MADKLAKEAAQQAKDLDEVSSIMTLEDVKTAAKTSGIKKWQDVWNHSERGRGWFQFRPKVGYQLKHSFDSQSTESWLSQLRTGNADLNSYQYKLGLKDSGECECGDIETIEHFLLSLPKV